MRSLNPHYDQEGVTIPAYASSDSYFEIIYLPLCCIQSRRGRHNSGNVSWEDLVGLVELVSDPEGTGAAALSPDLKEVRKRNVVRRVPKDIKLKNMVGRFFVRPRQRAPSAGPRETRHVVTPLSTAKSESMLKVIRIFG